MIRLRLVNRDNPYKYPYRLLFARTLKLEVDAVDKFRYRN